MGELTTTSVVRILRATREVSHAASHLAHVAAEVARTGPDGALAEAATDSALATARASFRLDDALRKSSPTAEDVRLALEILGETEVAILAARRSLEKALVAA